jgi:hypothetical protein
MCELVIHEKIGHLPEEVPFRDDSPCWKKRPSSKKPKAPPSPNTIARAKAKARVYRWNENLLASIGRVLGVWLCSDEGERLSVYDFCRCIVFALDRLKSGVKPLYQPPLHSKLDWHTRWLVQKWYWHDMQLVHARRNMIRAHTARRLVHQEMGKVLTSANQLFGSDARSWDDFNGLADREHTLLDPKGLYPPFVSILGSRLNTLKDERAAAQKELERVKTERRASEAEHQKMYALMRETNAGWEGMYNEQVALLKQERDTVHTLRRERNDLEEKLVEQETAKTALLREQLRGERAQHQITKRELGNRNDQLCSMMETLEHFPSKRQRTEPVEEEEEDDEQQGSAVAPPMERADKCTIM